MNIKLDLKDRKLLYELDLNSRQSNAEFAKKIGLSKDAVGYRIKRLEEKGVIRGFRTVIDSSRLGYQFYRVFFNLMDMQPKDLTQLIEFLKKEKNVWWIARLDGAWNFVFAIWVKNNKEFQEFYNHLCLNFRKNIKEQLICPVLSYKNMKRRYLAVKKEAVSWTSTGEGEKQEFDNADLKILAFLSENARTQLIIMAKELSVDSMTIFHRIKNMEKKGIIQGYNLDMDFSKLNRDFYSVKINLADTSRLKEVKEYILTIPELIATTEAIGSYDLEFDLEVENSEQYFKIIEYLENRFDFIREVAYFRVLRNHKIVYIPNLS